MSDIEECEGCSDKFLVWDLSDDGYCERCDYQHQANLDNLTGDYNE